MQIASEDIELDGRPMRVRVCAPRAAGRFPGIVLCSEIFQLTGPIRRAMERLAGHGYVVAAPEIFLRVEPRGAVIPDDDAGRERGLAAAQRTAVSEHDADRRAVLDWIERDPRVDAAKLGAMGFRIGGHLALRAALDARVSATVACCPTGVHNGKLGAAAHAGTLQELALARGSLLIVFGDADPHVPPEGRERISRALAGLENRVSIEHFAAEHAFMRDEGARYDAAACDAVWRLALEHFSRALGRVA
jgi:carboxymethylenebutenolidase